MTTSHLTVKCILIITIIQPTEFELVEQSPALVGYDMTTKKVNEPCFG